MRPHFLIPLLACTLLAACGVPQATLDDARTQTFLALQPPGDDAAVRVALANQADAWTNLSQGLRQRTFGGHLPPDAQFLALIDRTATIARRQRELISLHQDDPALNRQLYSAFAARWREMNEYLSK